MPNPWISLWLSAANSWAGAARGFWIGEMYRQQAALTDAMMRQTLRVWTDTLTPTTRTLDASRSKRRR